MLKARGQNSNIAGFVAYPLARTATSWTYATPYLNARGGQQQISQFTFYGRVAQATTPPPVVTPPPVEPPPVVTPPPVVIEPPPAPVPVPASVVMLGSALAGLGLVRRRRKLA